MMQIFVVPLLVCASAEELSRVHGGVTRGKCTNGKGRFDLAAQPDGVYFALLQGTEATVRVRVVKLGMQCTYID